MHERLSWRKLLPGLFVMAMLAVSTVAVLAFARVGVLRGTKVRVNVIAAEAAGLLAGSDVWYAGRRIGRVEGLDVLPLSSDSLARIVVHAEILDEHAALLRRDVTARIEIGGRLLGAPVLAFEGGTPGSPAIRDGDTLHSIPGGALASAAERAERAQQRLPILMQAARGAMTDLTEIARLTSGAMARLPVDRGRVVMTEAGEVMAGVSRLTSRGDGTLGARVATVRARIDSIRVVMASPNGTLGRFRRDSSLVGAIAGVRAELASLSAAASSPDGTLGRMAADSVLQQELATMSRELSALMIDIRKRPLRYISF